MNRAFRPPISRWMAAALWYGLLAGPTAWGVHLLVGYGAEEIVCSPSSTGTTLGGISIEPFVVVETAVLGGLTVLAAVVSTLGLRRTHDAPGPVGERVRWMAVAGLFSSTIFLAIILLGLIPSLFLDPCSRSL